MEILFERGAEVVLVRIYGHRVTFCNSQFGAVEADIEGIQYSYIGCIRSHPDLELRDDWKEESIKRLKQKIKELDTEDAIVKYIIEELKNQGYIPKQIQRKGFRREIIHG